MVPPSRPKLNCRHIRNLKKYGDIRAPLQPSRQSARQRKLTPREEVSVFWLKTHIHGATRSEVIKFVEATTEKQISKSTVSRTYKALGFTRKVMHYFSSVRDEEDRVNFHCNPPDHPTRPGIFGVSYLDHVDIDEGGRDVEGGQRHSGHSLIGVPCSQAGHPPRSGSRLTFCVGVDARVGTISEVVYPKGTTNEKFLVWMKYNLLPKIAGTGRRIITLDNLSSHLTPELRQLVSSHGHILVTRPTHSPDFGGVEWVFSYVDYYLNFHQSTLTDTNIKAALISAFVTVTPLDIAGYMAKAHIVVPGFPYIPYCGQQ